MKILLFFLFAIGLLLTALGIGGIFLSIESGDTLIGCVGVACLAIGPALICLSVRKDNNGN